MKVWNHRCEQGLVVGYDGQFIPLFNLHQNIVSTMGESGLECILISSQSATLESYIDETLQGIIGSKIITKNVKSITKMLKVRFLYIYIYKKRAQVLK